MLNRLLSVATLCFSMLLLSAAPGCAVSEPSDADVAAGQMADDVDDAAATNGDTLTDEGPRTVQTHRYQDSVPATDGVEAATDDTIELTRVDGIEIADLLEAARPKTVK